MSWILRGFHNCDMNDVLFVLLGILSENFKSLYLYIFNLSRAKQFIVSCWSCS